MSADREAANLAGRVQRALAIENGSGNTDPLSRGFLDSGDRLEIYREAAQAYIAGAAQRDGVSDREAAIRARFAWPTDDPDVTWLLAELAAAREWYRDHVTAEGIYDGAVWGDPFAISPQLRAALADGEGETGKVGTP